MLFRSVATVFPPNFKGSGYIVDEMAILHDKLTDVIDLINSTFSIQVRKFEILLLNEFNINSLKTFPATPRINFHTNWKCFIHFQPSPNFPRNGFLCISVSITTFCLVCLLYPFHGACI